ncbi:MAG: dihydrodipicolinate synthase family protein [Alphaproteobacteria bacterium]|nr:dihydrodipicolinate synthase family protein [Alphaproteobacteria bacterium]
MADLSGILPVLPTPFAADGAIDVEAIRRVTAFALSAGVNGVVFPGFASEVSELTAEERSQLLTSVVEEVVGTVPVIAGGSAKDAGAVIAHGQAALALGVGFLMIQPPLHLGSEAEPVAAFLGEIAAALPDMRIILQNAPAPRGSDLSPDTILEIARRSPQIAYVKEETLPAGPAITRIMADRPPSLQGVIGGGGARYILDEYERGASAAMPAVEIADLHVALDTAWREGRRDKARDLYVRTLPLLTLQTVYRMRLTKHVLVRRGIFENAEVRAPTPILDELAIADIDKNLVELGLIDDAGLSAALAT